MSNKDTYRMWAQTQKSMPIFLQPWWMDAVCIGKEWDVMIVVGSELGLSNSTDIIAAMPYLIRHRCGCHYILMPQQTQIGGVWIDENLSIDAKSQILAPLTKRVEEYLQSIGLSYYYQKYPIHSPLSLELQKYGYEVKEQITYRIEDTGDIASIQQAFSQNKKRQLKKAAHLQVSEDMTHEEFYTFHRECLRLQGKEISYSHDFFTSLAMATEENQCSKILAIRDSEQAICAAVFVVWDQHSTYYLIPCYHPAYKDSGAGALLATAAIRLAHEKSLAFDFEGSMIPGVAEHYRQFGSTKTIYYAVEKYFHPWFKLAMWWNSRKERKMR